MSTELATRNASAEAIETALIRGDLKPLTVPQRLEYYNQICESLGLNPLTQPFGYHEFNGKVVLYARKDATEQLRKIHNVSIIRLDREIADGLVIFTAHAKNGAGREDIGTGAVAIESLKGEARANAIMKAETKSKRRVTLSICGLGMLDETEIDSIPELPIPTTLETKALPEAVAAPGQVNTAPATEGSRPESGQKFAYQTVENPVPAAGFGDAHAGSVAITPVEVSTNAIGSPQTQKFPLARPETPSPAPVAEILPPAQPVTPTESVTSPKPTTEQFETFKKRATDLRVVLEKSGLKPSAKTGSSPAMSSGAKLVKYFTLTAGVQKLEELNTSQWNTVFSVLDALVNSNPAKAVEVIDSAVQGK